VKPYAEVLQKLGVKSAYVVYGNGLDEISLTGPTMYAKIKQGVISYGEFSPSSLGFESCEIDDLVGGEPEENYTQAMDILSGVMHGAKRNMVVVNAAAAIQVGSDFSLSWKESLRKAEWSLESGLALGKLKEISK
jgi:anthranilate phosphoribosyltransferase